MQSLQMTNFIWDKVYNQNQQLSLWPWSDLISKFYNFSKFKKNQKVLELGCGVGTNIPFFQSLKLDYHGIDKSFYAIERTKKKFKKYKKKIVKTDIAKSFFFKKKFDYIIDRACLTHCQNHELLIIISKIKKQLKRKGIFFGIDWFSKKSSDYKLIKEKISSGNFKNLGFVNFFSKKELIELFSEFKIIYLEEKTKKNQYNKKVLSSWDIVVINKN